MDTNEIHVGMADMEVSKSPDILASLGIGSCVAVTLYDPYNKIGGFAHIMLPDITVVKNKTNRKKFANTACEDLLAKMLEAGAKRNLIKAKIVGGAHMFGFAKSSILFDIGKRNVDKVKEVLNELNIRILAEDTGGDHGRSVFFDLETGKIRVRSVAHGEKFI